MYLELNNAAPLFALTDINGRDIRLEDYKGRKVFLGFFRHAGCPFCNLRVYTLKKVHKQLKGQGLEMIFFFESKPSVLSISSFHQEVSPIPLISDPDKEWYDAFGLEESNRKSTLGHITSFVKTAVHAKRKALPMHLMKDGESFGTMPAEFLLDENLIVRKLHYSQNLSDRMNTNEIFKFVQKPNPESAVV